ncbi:MAG: hypothetical protein SH856_09780 [Flavobacteriales bacterium]|nr:hypothetical protein [Flavobacteriales bacterium]
MSKIESNKALVNAAPEEVFLFLSNMNNIKKLLPENKISDWKSDEKSCSFKVQNAYTIPLVHVGGNPFSRVQIQSGEGAPFRFTLDVHLADKDGKTEGYLECNAQLNMFLEMMVKGPLKNLFDHMAGELAKQFP